MTEDTLREELTAKTRALVQAEAQRQRLLEDVRQFERDAEEIHGLAKRIEDDPTASEGTQDAAESIIACALTILRGRERPGPWPFDSLLKERDTLRAQLAEAQKTIDSLELQMSDVDRLHATVERQTRELAAYRSRLAACEPVIEAVREMQLAYHAWSMALPSANKDELLTVYQRKVAKLRASDLVLPAKVTT